MYRLRWIQLLTHLDYHSKTMCDTQPFTVRPLFIARCVIELLPLQMRDLADFPERQLHYWRKVKYQTAISNRKPEVEMLVFDDILVFLKKTSSGAYEFFSLDGHEVRGRHFTFVQ